MKRLFALMLTLCMLLSVQTHSAAAIETDMSTTPADRAFGYTLQHSTLYQWDPSTMQEYNCYAYVLGMTTKCNPGQFVILEDEDAEPVFYDDSKGVASLADVIKADLNGELGYECVKIDHDCPTSTAGWSNVIAVRKDNTYDLFSLEFGRLVNDYHVAKLTSTGWYHKPGKTAVLKFINAPSNSEIWTSENYNGTFNSGYITYDSELRFLLYKPEHGFIQYSWTGQHYHVKTKHHYIYEYRCVDCREVLRTELVIRDCSGPPCGVVRS